ncbi:MAG: helix-turn-helix domain-containing protein [Chlorobiota bacterium]
MNNSQIVQVHNTNEDALVSKIADKVTEQLTKIMQKNTAYDSKKQQKIEELKNKYASRDEACEMLNISLGTLNKMLRNKEIVHVKKGRYTLIPIQSIEDYLTRNTKTIED